MKSILSLLLIITFFIFISCESPYESTSTVLIDNSTHYIEMTDYRTTVELLIEVLVDTTDDRAGTWPNLDFYKVEVDKNQNGYIDDMIDVLYSTQNGTVGSLCTAYLHSENTSSGCGAFVSGATLSSSFDSSSKLMSDHIIWRLEIPKSELSSSNVANIVVKTYISGIGYLTYPTTNLYSNSGLVAFNECLEFTW